MAIVEDGHRDIGGVPGVLHAEIGRARPLFVAGQGQGVAAGFGLGPDCFINTAPVDHIFPDPHVPGAVLAQVVGGELGGGQQLHLENPHAQHHRRRQGPGQNAGGLRAFPAHQVQGQQRGGGEQQGGGGQEPPGVLEGGGRLGHGGAQPAFHKIPGEELHRQQQAEQPQAGNGAQGAGARGLPAAGQAEEGQRQPQQQRQAQRQGHIGGGAGGGAAKTGPEGVQQLDQVQPLPLGFAHQRVVDLQIHRQHGGKEGQQEPGAQAESQRRGLAPGQQPGRGQGLAQPQQAKDRQQGGGKLCGDQVALHQGRHAEGQRRPLGEAGSLAGVDLPYAQQDQRQKTHGRVLAQSGAEPDAHQPVAGKRIQRRPQHAVTAAAGDARKAQVAGPGGGQRGGQHIRLVAGAQGQPGVVQQGGQQQEQFTVTQRVDVAVAVQGGGGHAHRELPVGKFLRHGGDTLQMVVQVMAEVQLVAEQRQAGGGRNAQQGQRHRRQAAGASGGSHAEEQPGQQVADGKKQGEAGQPGHAVHGLFHQRDGIEIELAPVIVQGGLQVVHPRAAADPQPGGQRAVAVVQRQRVGLHGGGRLRRRERQRPGALQDVEGGGVGRLAGEILHGHFIRAGSQRHRRGGKGDLLLTLKALVVVDPQRTVVAVQPGERGEQVLEPLGRDGRAVGRAEQPGREHQQHGGLGGQRQGQPAVAAQQGGKISHRATSSGWISRPRS